jgi:hypothetical protein
MFSFVPPEDSAAEHERLLGTQERILQALEIPYRVVDIAAGDLGASAARKFDCEAWIPSQERYREVTSCSNTTDYQARRLGCRFRSEPAPGRSCAHQKRHPGRSRPHLIALFERAARRRLGGASPALRRRSAADDRRSRRACGPSGPA